ncbi:MAG: hypothetical protein ACLQVD_02335 [Capsulimonadaceae bacterium]
MKKNALLFSRLDQASLLEDTGNQPFRDSLFARIHSNASSLLVLIGHSENGNLKGPDGSTVALKEINDECNKSSRPAIILSCSTVEHSSQIVNGVVTPRNIEFDEVAEALRYVQGKVGASNDATVQDFISHLSVGLQESEQRRHTKLVVVVSFTGALAMTVAVYDADCKNGNLPCSN